ncbi:DEAD-box ATP-dependent RNA helicase 13 isoform X1 [Selaginella moellendorffii]|uniref:DEAD-box ATP-dependent RNA helicase 13 isoform X1 n=1 Tax=Selaginella moellendorffii TaxID=88036 RepID=UPI000D1C46C0|nr:DEAD-box ATP-dependent RNA helicase 13 isoform X1 [Selaginella moellendorffii]XP_024532886.1 DEAD-box ATP-dependent RNA helicase 13 isoform X1 [Selaginella moellendorffii]|eukprot:XP_024532885.1 DEAD-box ATP-dependent RNA helicase 13 isoform X1 [Selaginella moellendorffii]
MGRKKKGGTGEAWKDVTPQEPTSLLLGSGQGGFVSLEEIDEDLVFGLEPPAGEDLSGKNAKKGKRKRALETDLAEEKNAKKNKKRKEKILASDTDLAEGHAATRKEKKKKKKGNAEPDDAAQDKEALNSPRGKKRKNKRLRENTTSGANKRSKLDGGDNGSEGLERVDVVLPEWNELRLHPSLLTALSTLGFTTPTPIQKACIPAAAHKGKDVIGAAETGSGKTLAFGIPILQRLLDERDKLLRQNNVASDSPLRALIVTPTRELALQICDHIRAVAKFTDIKVAPIVGGISTQKQERLLKRRPAIVVGTPGRLWELMSSGESHLVQLQEISFFILDEADRMIEKGHFQELESIIDLLPKHGEPREDLDPADNVFLSAKKRRQTLVFSATLTLPPDFKKKLKKSYGARKKSEQHSLSLLSERAGLSDTAEVVDLTSKNVVAEKLTESVIECTDEEKDAYLYYVLKVHGCGRTIVFCTSIAALRRLAAILRLLEVPAWPLHAQLQQRQRLKTMDRFRASTDGVLVATDVAARGLDIPGVRTVIHYQLPHSAEMYVHRSGRTARADKDGCSIALISPSEKSKYLTLCRALSKSSGLTSFPINSGYIPSVEKRIGLALRIDRLLRENSKKKAKSTWFERNAKELDIEIERKDEDNDNVEAKLSGKKSMQLRSLQEELKQTLKHPLELRGFSRRFVAGTGLTPLAAQQLKDYVDNAPGGRFVVIGQKEVEPLQALKAQQCG